VIEGLARRALLARVGRGAQVRQQAGLPPAVADGGPRDLEPCLLSPHDHLQVGWVHLFQLHGGLRVELLDGPVDQVAAAVRLDGRMMPWSRGWMCDVV